MLIQNNKFDTQSKYIELDKKYEISLKEIEYLKKTVDELTPIKNEYIELEKSYGIVLKENEYLKKITDELTPLKNDYLAMLKLSHESTTKVMSLNSETSKINAEVSAKSLGTIKYISKHLNNAPPLKYKEDEIVGLLEYTSSKKYKAIDYILYNKTVNKLDKWVGDIILQIYKKENPFEQSIWATDASRYSYLICEVIEGVNGKRSDWITDRSGTKITEIIINPTLELVAETIHTYLDETLEHDVDAMTIEGVMKTTANRNTANEILKNILDTKLHKEVLKYITPSLCADLIFLEDAMNKSIIDDNESVASVESVSIKLQKNKKVKKKKDVTSVSSNSNSDTSSVRSIVTAKLTDSKPNKKKSISDIKIPKKKVNVNTDSGSNSEIENKTNKKLSMIDTKMSKKKKI
jgi:hypothetical protein